MTLSAAQRDRQRVEMVQRINALSAQVNVLTGALQQLRTEHAALVDAYHTMDRARWGAFMQRLTLWQRLRWIVWGDGR